MSKSWKEVTSEEELDQISVTLRPHLGMGPDLYVPLGWGALALLFLFMVLLLPGLRSYGTVLTIESSPAGAEVLVDGVRRGVTPLQTFVEAGERSLQLSFPGFDRLEEEINLQGRRLGSALFPRRERLSFTFSNADEQLLVSRTITDFSSWALGPEPGPQFQHAPAARDGARGIWASVDNVESEESVSSKVFSRNLLAHAQPFQAPDLLGAALRVHNPGGVLNGASVAVMVHDFIQLDNDYPGFHRVLRHVTYPYDDIPGSWYRAREDALSTTLLALSVSLDEGHVPASRTRTVAGIEFGAVPAGSYAVGYPLRTDDATGVIVETPSPFWIQAGEVSRADYARFLRDQPQWLPERVREASLPDYLLDWPSDWERWLDDGTAPEAQLPVRYVHRPAAQAFARWLQGRASLSGEKIRLPHAAEWEYAAFLNDPGEHDRVRDLRQGSVLQEGALGITVMAGNLWEWTVDRYGVHSHVLPADYGTLVTVMGGSFANTSPSHALRGGQPEESTTPFLGFRLVIVPEVFN